MSCCRSCGALAGSPPTAATAFSLTTSPLSASMTSNGALLPPPAFSAFERNARVLPLNTSVEVEEDKDAAGAEGGGGISTTVAVHKATPCTTTAVYDGDVVLSKCRLNFAARFTR